MKKHILTVAFATLCLGFGSMLSAQTSSPTAFKTMLAQPAADGSRISISEADDIRVQVNRMPVGKSTIQGYRVRIFVDNNQNARSNAQAIQRRFSEAFPGIPVYLVYEAPNYKVTVGNCLTSDEAVMLWGRVRESFERAFVVREEVPLTALAEAPLPALPADSSADAANTPSL
ncbi:MAG: hypothetical protein LBU80_01555 [Rikenellaceae bacterium]|jgi:hypothetical protein|nr:hypothetical protein [Rikenellaceae bacterium]